MVDRCCLRPKEVRKGAKKQRGITGLQDIPGVRPHEGGEPVWSGTITDMLNLPGRGIDRRSDRRINTHDA